MLVGTSRQGPTTPGRSSATRWQRLYFLPLPHQQSSLARTVARGGEDVTTSSPPAVCPFLEMWSFRSDRGVEAVAREDQRLARQREEAAVDGLDDRPEVAAREGCVAGAPGEQRVAAEQDRMSVE